MQLLTNTRVLCAVYTTCAVFVLTQLAVRGCVPQALQDLQFGRDAGTPSYNAVRAALGLAPARSFEQVR
jgi:hypothetical protein